MIEFGKTLREAREAKGLGIADIAERTHMMSSMIADLENEDFSRLAAPIYGRGFVKLYCQTVGIDPAPMIAEFMEIYNGNREPAIRERAVPAAEPAPESAPATVAAPEPEPEPEPAAEIPAGQSAEPALPTPEPIVAAEPPFSEQLDLFSTPRERPVRSAPPPVRPVVPAEPAAYETETPPKREHPFAHYATPFREHASEISGIAPAFGRWCVVLIVLCLILGGICLGVRALYRATNDAAVPPDSPVLEPSVPTTPAPAASDVKTSRTPIDVPPLYID